MVNGQCQLHLLNHLLGKRTSFQMQFMLPQLKDTITVVTPSPETQVLHTCDPFTHSSSHLRALKTAQHDVWERGRSHGE